MPSPSRSFEYGRRPIATTTLSTSTVLRTRGVRVLERHAVLATVGAVDLGAEADVETVLLEVLQRFLRELLVRHGRNCSSASSTTTSAPRRRQTLPSSSPMTPAPITPSRFGTASNSSAPQESTTVLPSNGTDLSSIGAEPDASTTCFAMSSSFVPSPAVYSTRLPREQLAVTLQPGDAGGLEQTRDALRRVP